MLFGIFFVCWRLFEIITLVPIVGMLGYFVNIFLESNVMVPSHYLVLFIVSVLALAWALGTLFSYHRSKAHANFVALIDMAFVGAFIAAAYYLRFITRHNCTSVRRGSTAEQEFRFLGASGNISLPTIEIDINKPCAMAKASFAFGIINCIVFFCTSLLAWCYGDRAAKDRRRYEERRSSRHRSHSGHRSHRSSHSHSRAYV
ncbi:hypothetical protein VTJ83DRAFT_3303 [Remersonia thermophila]|uniref:MARVEL domain-containing protein n=1 Tax=Remersonia thermophila TaxID=72144 RepID=A0ABR4DFU4_9PEZI